MPRQPRLVTPARQPVRALAVLAVTGALVAACASGASPEADPTGTTSAAGRSMAPTTTAATASEEPVAEVETTPPAPVVPAAGECRVSDGVSTPAADIRLTECAEPHRFETAYVGSFDDALGVDVVADRDVALATAFLACRAPVAEYLGGPRHGSRITLRPRVPTGGEWGDGARWYACDLARLSLGEDGVVGSETGSLRGVLANGPGTFRSCELLDDRGTPATGDDQQVHVSCDQPHHIQGVDQNVDLTAELADFPGDEVLSSIGQERCPGLVVEYLGASRQDIDVRWTWPDANGWEAGFRDILCQVMVDAPISGSLAGIGGGPLPFVG